MIIYNLTDRTPPWELTPRTPNKVKVRGVTILPGQHEELTDFPLKEVTGLINAHTISVDGVPSWYQEKTAFANQAKQATLLAQAAAKAKEDE